MLRILARAAIGAVLTIGLAGLLLAAVVTAPLAAETTTVTIPWGDWLSELLGIAGSIIVTLLGALLAWAVGLIPATLRAYITDQRIRQVEQLLGRAVDYGIAATQGAVRGSALGIDVGSEVLANAAQYAVDRGPPKIVAWMGGEDAIREMILARLNLNASAGDLIIDGTPPISR